MNCSPIENKVTVGISACLHGDAVRYDGNDKRHHLILNTLSPFVHWSPFCPEVAAKLGVPRPPIKLIATSKRIAAIGVDDSALDVTDALSDTSQRYWSEIFSSTQSSPAGFIFKSRSPSCGMGSTPLFYTDEQLTTALTHGLFAAEALKVREVRRLTYADTGLAFVEDEWLTSEERCYRFLAACYLASTDSVGITDNLMLIVKGNLFLDLPQTKAIDLLLQPNEEAALERRLCDYFQSWS